MLLREELQIDAINSNFENFESAFYMKSVSMPLICPAVWIHKAILCIAVAYI